MLQISTDIDRLFFKKPTRYQKMIDLFEIMFYELLLFPGNAPEQFVLSI